MVDRNVPSLADPRDRRPRRRHPRCRAGAVPAVEAVGRRHRRPGRARRRGADHGRPVDEHHRPPRRRRRPPSPPRTTTSPPRRRRRPRPRPHDDDGATDDAAARAGRRPVHLHRPRHHRCRRAPPGSERRRVRPARSARHQNGPDLFVYLSTNPPDGPEGAFDDDFVNLGRLEGNVGSSNYVVPAGTDLSRYASVVIWCDRFNSAFGAAPLSVSVPRPAYPAVTEGR